MIRKKALAEADAAYRQAAAEETLRMRAPRCHNRTVTRTTVFEFSDSRAGMCRLVPKRVLPFGISKTTVLACDPLCHVAPCGWFGIWFAKLVTTDVRFSSKADLSDTRHYVSDPKRTCHPR